MNRVETRLSVCLSVCLRACYHHKELRGHAQHCKCLAQSWLNNHSALPRNSNSPIPSDPLKLKKSLFNLNFYFKTNRTGYHWPYWLYPMNACVLKSTFLCVCVCVCLCVCERARAGAFHFTILSLVEKHEVWVKKWQGFRHKWTRNNRSNIPAR
jgi:hypothetical protein